MTIRNRNGAIPSRRLGTSRLQFRMGPITRAAVLLLAAGSAHAQQAFSPAWFGAKGAAQRSAVQTGLLPNGMPVNSLQKPAEQRAGAQRSLNNLNLAARAIAQQQAVQRAAREAALAAPSTVPDGLGEGGLKVDTGSLTAGWLNANAPTQTVSGGKTEVTIEQTAPKAILNWETFNVGRDTTVTFDQKGGNLAGGKNEWIALNRVNDPNGKPSEIAGQIKADGSVYIINRNGIIFTGTSQVDTRGLVASTLALSNAQFQRGINNPIAVSHMWAGDALLPAFGDHAPDSSMSYLREDAWTPTDPTPGHVTVQAGAKIGVSDGGKLLLLGTQVRNAGSLNVRDGQVILAAGEQVWLSEDQNGVRGLDIAVNGPMPYLTLFGTVTNIALNQPIFSLIEHHKIMKDEVMPMLEARAAALDYNVENTGSVNADRGNITMEARDVRQNGVLTASTALNNRDGSIRLRAFGLGLLGGGPGVFESNEFESAHWTAGTLTLGEGSVALVMPDLADRSEIEATDLATRYTPGSISLYGKLIDARSGSLTMAPGGLIEVIASETPFFRGNKPPMAVGTGGNPDDGSRIHIDTGAVVSVAGLQDVAVAMSRNFIEVDLRINELRDSPLLRDSWLRGQKLVVDRRESGAFDFGPMAGVLWGDEAGAWHGTPLADVSGWIGVGKTDLMELSATGGTLNLKAGGDLITRVGSLLDVSGGSVRYDSGWNTASRLQAADGSIRTMGDASPDLLYVGAAGRFIDTHARWGATETFSSPLLAGRAIEAGYTEGRNAGKLAMYVGQGAVLEGEIDGGVVTGDRQQGGQGAAKAGTWAFGGGSNLEWAWNLGKLTISDAPERLGGGFTRDTALDSRWRQADGGTASWLDASVLSRSGMGNIQLHVTDDFTLTENTHLQLAPGSAFAVNLSTGMGQDVEFRVDGSIRSVGGAVTLINENPDSGSLTLGQGAVIDVSGQWHNGTPDTALVLDGGSIRLGSRDLVVDGRATLAVNGGGHAWRDGNTRNLAMGDAGSIQLSGVDAEALARLDLQGFAGGSGGALTLAVTGDVSIGTGTSALQIPAHLYGDRGFRSVSLDVKGAVDVADGVQVGLTPLGWDLAAVDYESIASGSRLGDHVDASVARPEVRLANDPVALRIDATGPGGFRLGTGASLQVDTGGSVSVRAPDVQLLGTIEAPAGAITVQGDETVTLATGANLLARGVAVTWDNAQGLQVGQVLDGGKVTLSSKVLDLQAGSLVDVSGTSAIVESRGAAGEPVLHFVASHGGSVSITGRGVVEGQLQGAAGGTGAHGGSLSFAHVDASVQGDPGTLLLKQFCGVFGFCEASQVIGVDFAVVLEQYGFPGYPQMIVSQALMDHLGALQRVGVSVTNAALPGAGGGAAPIDFGAFGLSDEALDGFRDIAGIDLRAISPATSLLTVRPGTLAGGGFADLAFRSVGGVELGDVALAADRSITVSGVLARAPGESAGARLAAPLIVLQRPGATGVPGAAAEREGELVLDASVVEVRGGRDIDAQYGPASIRGFARTRIDSDELRFSVVSNRTAGALGPEAADSTLDVDGAVNVVTGQVYPATGVNARLVSGERIEVHSNGAAPAAPLSAGGSLTLAAPVIEQHGVLRAPFGQITLAAGERLVLGSGSLTSVSGDGLLVPYGALLNSEYWADPFGSAGEHGIAALPDKRVVLKAPVVEVAGGSVVDIRGGGDLLAREFVPGSGGSHDILALAGAYAVLPGHTSPLAPGAGGATAGASLWLAGGNGLAAGWYTLLPPSYAALPGAFLVLPTGGGTTPGASNLGTAASADGSVVMAGRTGNALAGSASASTGWWQVMNGAQLRQYSEYSEARASAFFASDAFKLTQYRLTGVERVTPRLTTDAGAVVFRATHELAFDGTLLAQGGAGADGTAGRGGLVDIVAERIAIVGAGQDRAALEDQGYLVLGSDVLAKFGAGSLLIGGTRSGDARGLALDIEAREVLVRNDSRSALTGGEIILAASDLLAVADGSVIRAEGKADAGGTNLIVRPQQVAVYTDPDGQLDDNFDGKIDHLDAVDDVLTTPVRDWGALLRVSNAGAAQVVRSEVDASRGGQVTIGEGATLGGAAVLIDATRTTTLAGTARLSGESLSVAAGQISLGGGTDGLVLGAESLAQLADTKSLTLRSYGSIDVFGDVDFGGSGLAQVVLDAGRITGHGGDVRVEAATLTLLNSGAALPASGPAAADGQLQLVADTLVLGAGDKRIDGFATVELAARQRVLADEAGRLDAGSAELSLQTPLLTGRRGANQAIVTTGTLRVGAAGDAPAGPPEDSLGATLSLTGGSVDVRGRIVALGGAVSVEALTGDVVLDATSRIDVGGFARDFHDVTAYADAGRISLQAREGNIRQVRGGVLNVAAHAGGGQAGTLAVRTTGDGTVTLDGTMTAQAGAGGRGGSFALDVAELADFGALAQTLNTAGFSAARDFRVRTGDVTVDGTTRVADFRLSADRGTVTLAGTIDARSTHGGRIEIDAGEGVTLQGTALLQAGATDAVLGSGRVSIEASGGVLDLRGGTIDVAGGEGGRVRLRARQNAAHDDLAVAALDVTVRGARSAVLEGVSVYESGTVEAVKAQTIADAEAFSAHTGAIAARLGGARVDLMPGIEIRSTGDLVLGEDWNLAESFGTGQREGSLTLRAAGNLIVSGNLSDGFDRADRDGALLDAASWDLRLVSGADLAASRAMAVRSAGQLAADSGNFTVGSGTAGYLVRTGTGDLQAAAARDIDLAHQASVIYTAGRRDTTAWADFTTTPGAAELTGPTWSPVIGTVALPTAAYGIQGGHLDLNAGGDIRTVPVPVAESQFFGEWLLRLGRKEQDLNQDPKVVTPDMPFQPGEQATWFVNYAKFNQGVGALGGGNVAVKAGGDIDGLLVAQPTHGRVRGGRTAGEAMVLEVGNGGTMDVVAEGAIRGGQYYLGRGEGHIVAGALQKGSGAGAVAPVLALGDSVLHVTTRGDMAVSTVADPLMTDQHYLNADGPSGSRSIYGAYMSGYTERSALDLRAVGGDLTLGEEIAYRMGQDLYPAKLGLTALSGSVSNEAGHFNPVSSDDPRYRLPRSGVIFTVPSAQTDLRILAEEDVRLGQIVMSRLAPDAMPQPTNPMRDYIGYFQTWLVDPTAGGLPFTVSQRMDPSINWLADDHTPSRIYARSGSVVREVSGSVMAGEQLWVRAGKDIRGLRLNLRNHHADDVSWLQAGNDILGVTSNAELMANPNTKPAITVQGPGSLVVAAGRDVYNVDAISMGNIQRWDGNNFSDQTSRVPHLGDEGASITVMAGLTGRDADYAAFIQAYLDPSRVAGMGAHLVATLPDGTRIPRYLVDLQDTRASGQVKTVQRGLVSYVEEVTGESLSPLAAWDRFNALPVLAQQVFVRRVFLQELREAGRNQNQPGGADGLPLHGGYNRGYAAIDTLFPGDDWAGSVLADSLTLRTMRGGDVNVFAPGGRVQAASLVHTPAAGDGVVTLAGGHIGIFADDSLVVNRSRVLAFVPEATQQGSDMVIWSTHGDVDAGRGAKTVRVPSRPIVVTDENAFTTVTERSDMSGSGIGTVGEGDVDLVAPGGTINAGDAGIRVAGNLNLAALHVVNADNIDVEGDAVGLPVIAAVNIGALTSASAASAQATAAAQDVLQRQRSVAREALPSIVTVRVLSSEPGDGASAPSPAPAEQRSGVSGYDAANPVQLVGNGQRFDPAGWAQLTEQERRALRSQR